MDSQVPRSSLKLYAGSLADDLSYVALADVVSALKESGKASAYRLIGGQMVTLLAARWNLGSELERDTKDADVGTYKLALISGEIVEHLKAKKYKQIEGNRFERLVEDLPIGGVEGTDQQTHSAVVDLLIADQIGRVRDSVEVGGIVTTEVPGLATALNCSPIELELVVTRLNGLPLTIPVVVPDEASALILKTLAWDIRPEKKDTDAVDIWRCLEIALAAGVMPSALESSDGRKARALLNQEFGRDRGDAMRAIEGYCNLSGNAASERETRIKALIRRVCGT